MSKLDNRIRNQNELFYAGLDLLQFGKRVDTGEWQSLRDENLPQHKTIELMNYVVRVEIPETIEDLQDQVNPNLPWAEDHFQERVGGEPLNPGEQYKNWPWYKGNVETHKQPGQFSHTYMERFWPKYAGNPQVWPDSETWGLRYRLGDLDDVVDLLMRSPHTRQAYLPVWFPEDTGAVHGERVPCTLGYHFLLREGKLHITYFIRSCDFLRHFRDDVYMAARLCQWMIDEVRRMEEVRDKSWDEVLPGSLTMHMVSFHIFEGDLPKMRRIYGQDK